LSELTKLGRLNDHYAILGFNDQATTAEIKKPYHGLARIYHPDKASGRSDARPDATAVYSKIVSAF
jgi:DnaJ-class molecular chaperone